MSLPPLLPGTLISGKLGVIKAADPNITNTISVKAGGISISRDGGLVIRMGFFDDPQTHSFEYADRKYEFTPPNELIDIADELVADTVTDADFVQLNLLFDPQLIGDSE